MRLKIILFFTLLSGSFLTKAQNELTNSASEYTYIYKLDSKDAFKVYKKKKTESISERYLKNLVDSFPSNSTFRQKLPAGHYIFLKAYNDQLVGKIKTVAPISIHLINNSSDLLFLITDENGNRIEDAIVKAGNKIISFDSTIHLYSGHKCKDWIVVTYKGEDFFYQLSSRKRKNKKNKIEKPYNGYIILNQPKYKPFDTLRVKAFILRRKKAMRDPVRFILKENSYGKLVLDTTIKPLRKGVFLFDFPLSDSLTTDKTYSIEISNKKNKRFSAYSSFFLEEYELKHSNYFIKPSLNDTYFLFDTILFTINAKDANGLDIPDASLKVTIETNKIRTVCADKEYYPFILYEKTLLLQPSGNTILSISQPLLNGTIAECKVTAHFFNSDNESYDTTFYFNINNLRHTVKSKIEDGYLQADFLKEGKSIDTSGILYCIHNGDTIRTKKITFPYKEKLDPMASSFNVTAGDLNSIISTDNSDRPLDLEKKTGQFLIKNYSQIEYYYQLYRDDKKIKQGTSNDSLFFINVQEHSNYLLNVWYMWGGNLKYLASTIRKDKYKITVEDNLPDKIFPGQKINISLKATDFKGKPASGIELTAGAVNSSFKYFTLPNIPDKSKPYPHKYFNNNYSEVYGPNIRQDLSKPLRDKFSIDSINYYKLIYPDAKGFFYYSKTNIGLAQFAPHIFRNGKKQTIYYIEADGVPVYWFEAYKENFSFIIDPGYHTILIRTKRKEIVVDSVLVKENSKLDFSVDLKKHDNKIHIQTTPSRLSEEQLRKLRNKMISINSLSNIWIGTKNEVYAADHSYSSLIGPVNKDTIIIKSKSSEQDFNIVNGGGKKYYVTQSEIKEDSSYRYSTNGKFKRYYYSTREQSPGKAITDWKNFYRYSYAQNSNNSSSVTGKGNGTYYFFYSGSSKIISYRFSDEIDSLKTEDGTFTPPSFNSFSKTLYNLNPGKHILTINTEQGTIINDVFIKPDTILVEKISDSLMIQNFSTLSEIVNTKSIGYNNGYFDQNYNHYTNLSFFYNYRNSINFNLNSFILDSYSGILELIPIPHKRSYHVKHNYNAIGGSFKLSTFNGDINTNANPGLSIDIITRRAPRLFIRRELIWTTISGSAEYHFSIGNSTVNKFRNSIFQFSYTALYTLFKNAGRYTKRPDYNFYALGGISLLYNNPKSFIDGKWRSIHTLSEKHFSKVQPAIPVGVGVTYKLNKQFDLWADWTYYLSFTDFLDGIKTGTKKDGFNLFNIRLSYTIPARVIDPKFRTGGRPTYAPYIDESSTHILESRRADSSAISDLETLFTDPSLNRLRSNFRDYGFWKPDLVTDKNGKTSFEASFPDDITKWKTYVFGMNNKLQGVSLIKDIKSYKPITSTLSVPRFLIEGDTGSAIGKYINYTNESSSGITYFLAKNDTIRKEYKQIQKSEASHLSLTSKTTDTLNVAYLLKLNNGYVDGEEKSIPVFRKGVEETKGQFWSFIKDTTITNPFKNEEGDVEIFISSNLQGILLDEVEKVNRYPYYCVEQMSSKLIALLAEKEIKKKSGEKFNSEKRITDLINKIKKSANHDGSWGWWPQTSPNIFITAYALKALKKAELAGYKVPSFEAAVKWLKYWKDSKENYNIEILHTFSILGISIDTGKDLAKARPENIYEKLQLLQIKQEAGISVDTALKNLLKNKRETALGNYYWGEENYSWHSNNTQATVLAYQILRKAGGYEKDLEKIQQYFIEQRYSGQWMNTSESASIISTILPDVLTRVDNGVSTTEVTLYGKIVDTLNTFPAHKKIDVPVDSIKISTKGKDIIYFSVFKKKWNLEPKGTGKIFKINTSFSSTGKTTDTLISAEPANISVKVNALVSNYIMIEVPIPAGCSYADDQITNRFETHREYHKGKVIIFCELLPEGEHEFKIALDPRFPGIYNINPAKVQLMYFPTIYATEGMKKIVVK